ncbi:shikimate kinase [Paenibacillus sp. NPDC058071]|uniref:shikimate kinase n=1 Tax=Paenibacillus sp. NPDC058071 TaxID=3346326 RepID=UPI0036D880EA
MERQAHRKIVLVGFMGTGKSTVSKLIAERLGWERFDSDEEIERRERKQIPQLFETVGEAGFREIESSVIDTLLSGPNDAVIATGGGAVLLERNRERMLANSYVVALTASAERIITRVKSDTSRPLLQGDVAANVHRIMEQRKHAYDFAHLKLDTSGMSAFEAADAIMERINY